MSTIDMATLQDWLSTGQPVTVLDVRPKAQRDEWAIPGSQYADVYTALTAEDPTALADIELPLHIPVVTVCGAGRVSLIAAHQLQQRGFQSYSLIGGMQAWSLAWNWAPIPTSDPQVQVIQLRRTGKGCLSYLIGADSRALVIDASLPPEVYVSLARRNGWQITAVVDTHIHADHLSRSRSLAAHTGARLYLPAQDRIQFPFDPLTHEQVIETGTIRLTALHTPGHTLESMSYLFDHQLLFTGDTLFLDGIGRPDLEATSAQAQERAHLLYASLQRILALPPETLILPGHTSRPVAFDHHPLLAPLADVQRRVPRLALSEAVFVAEVLRHLPAPPPHHHEIIALNEAGTPPTNTHAALEVGANRCAIP